MQYGRLARGAVSRHCLRTKKVPIVSQEHPSHANAPVEVLCLSRLSGSLAAETICKQTPRWSTCTIPNVSFNGLFRSFWPVMLPPPRHDTSRPVTNRPTLRTLATTFPQ